MRVAIPEDAEDIEMLEAELFPDNCFNANTLRKEMKIGQCWVEYKGKKLVGYLLARTEGGIMDILRVAVSPSHGGRGIATRLLTRALHGTQRAILCVKKNNDRAIRLYFHMGFEIVAHIPRLEVWVMSTSDGC